MKKREHESGNRQIIITAYIFATVFVGLIIYLAYFMLIQRETVVANPYNTMRQEVLAAQNIRGRILSTDGEVLAYTKVDREDHSETRTYPYDNLFAHVVGFSTNGRSGIEASANYYLLSSHENLSGQIANDLADTKNLGDNVITTLDLNLQQVAYKALGAYDGAVIVMNPKTGEILAMVSKPDFNPNEISTIWDSLIEDDDNSELVNRATQGQYPPGSTFKLITALEYIRENPDTWQDYSFQCNGSYKAEDGTTIHCYAHNAHGNVSFAKSFAYSCNSSFANIGMSLDRGSFTATLTDMLFNTAIPGSVACNRSSINISDELSDYDMMQASIGQGATLISPMHLCMITGAIANRGILMEPYVISGVENCNGSSVKTFSSKEYGSVMTEDEAFILTEMMTEVCDYGTGRKLADADYTAAGKTGSAEFTDTSNESHAWFTGFAPAEDPEIVVTVVIEGIGSGGDYAVPIAKRVFDAYFAAEQAGKR